MAARRLGPDPPAKAAPRTAASQRQCEVTRSDHDMCSLWTCCLYERSIRSKRRWRQEAARARASIARSGLPLDFLDCPAWQKRVRFARRERAATIATQRGCENQKVGLAGGDLRRSARSGEPVETRRRTCEGAGSMRRVVDSKYTADEGRERKQRSDQQRRDASFVSNVDSLPLIEHGAPVVILPDIHRHFSNTRWVSSPPGEI